GFGVDVRDQSEWVPFDAVANINYTLLGCPSVSMSPSVPGPQDNVVVTWTAVANCYRTPQYRFWTSPPGTNSPWTVAQDYSTNNQFNFNTSSTSFGTWRLEVDVRNTGSSSAYEAVFNTTYTVGPPICNAPSFSASPASMAGSGTTVTLQASTAGCDFPRYRFWVGQNGIWTIVQDYSATTTFNWTPTVPCTYGLEVEVRDANSSVAYYHVANLTYTVQGCSAVTLTGSPPNQALHGGFSVIFTGSGTCPGTPTYRFWVRAPGGNWTIVQDFSTTS